MDPEGPDVVRFGLEESEVALVLHLHLLDVALRRPPHGALHVEHAEQAGALRGRVEMKGRHKWVKEGRKQISVNKQKLNQNKYLPTMIGRNGT